MKGKGRLGGAFLGKVQFWWYPGVEEKLKNHKRNIPCTYAKSATVVV